MMTPRGDGAEAGLAPQARRLGDLDVLQVILVTRRKLEHVVRCLVVIHKKARFRRIAPILHPVQHQIQCDIGDMAIRLDGVFRPGFFAPNEEGGIEIFINIGKLKY